MYRAMFSVYVLLACTCGANKPAAPSPAAAPEPAPPPPAFPQWTLSIDERVAIDPRAAELMQWVVPLQLGSGTTCSATKIGDHALLTAAHCIDGLDPPRPEVQGVAESIRALDHRACGHGSCERPFPVGQYEHFREDVATMWLDNSMPAVGPPDPPGLANVRGQAPGAFMLSARTGHAHPVCRAYTNDDNVSQVTGSVERGDSGSSVIGLRTNGMPMILGVVTHRVERGNEWYFASIADPLPWPEAATAAGASAPSVMVLNESDFDTIRDCNP
jgi:trypsin